MTAHPTMPGTRPLRGNDTIVQVTHRPKMRSMAVNPATEGAGGPVKVSHFKIRLANTESRRSNASYLIKRQFAWRGYQTGPLADAPANQITLAAFGDEDVPVATITVGIDSPAGMSLEAVYPEELQGLRGDGRRLGEFTKLAVDSVVKSMPVLAAIFHIAYIYAYRIRGCTDLVVEVNPRHVRFYISMLGFEKHGEVRIDPRVGAPAVLLKLDLAHAEREIAQYGGHAELAQTVRTLYPLFFSSDEERGIEGRLRALE